jgi:hypothetical protein
LPEVQKKDNRLHIAFYSSVLAAQLKYRSAGNTYKDTSQWRNADTTPSQHRCRLPHGNSGESAMVGMVGDSA